ncbi:gamma-glutamyltransferase [Sabulicella rubraurantiaca]|uniref:gamma-glutamyltransferase n=1 Tax=Sabulicella rubraurantiaca TaxID=2811429 RepID=UPI001F184B3F|nr:gamma-glutamyltransferase [Sabulicella rubraurantiaca]
MASWRDRAGSPFFPEKHPATGRRGMVVTNHPAASAAGAQMLAEGGTATDAAVAALLALSVCEPMMVGLFGGGMMHLAGSDGRHAILDGMASAPFSARPEMFEDHPPTRRTVGALSVCVPRNLLAWEEALRRFGRFTLADCAEPAIRLAERGFRTGGYLAECVAETAPDLARDRAIAALFMPGGTPLPAGSLLRNPALGETLRAVAKEGAATLHGGDVGSSAVLQLARRGGIVSTDDLAAVRAGWRDPVRGTYRGAEVIGPPPPSAGGVHLLQMLKVMEGFDVARLGFGTAASLHLVAECLKIAFADRAAATADPDFIPVPVTRLLDQAYAADRRALIDPAAARRWTAGVEPSREGANTTHVTVADGEGGIACCTHTINSLFGARLLLPETGLIPNNYMALFDPVPGRAQSVEACKRVTTSMAPTVIRRDGAPWAALGLPGGLRIFGSVFQAVMNLLDHKMSLQEAVEAPRIWTDGGKVEVEAGIAPAARSALAALGHEVQAVPHVAGGMCGIRFEEDGMLEGAACWRADGAPLGLGGGPARQGVRFWPDAGTPKA